MEEQDDEVGMMERSTTSSWSAAEGTLEQSVKVVEESEDAVYTAGPTSRLVLVPRPLSSEGSSSAGEPCELTVTFEKRYGHIHQIYMLSTARICEVYGEKEKGGDRDYVCTVRGGIISLSDDEESADDASDAPEQEDLPSANTESKANFIPEFDSAPDVKQQVLPSEDQPAETVAAGKMDSSRPGEDSPSIMRRDSEDDLFRSFTEAINGRIVDGSIVFEESLDHADWVECPHSPLKSASLSQSDDETEVDINKSEFFFIDADVEAQQQQQADHPQVRLFTDAIRASGKTSTSPPLERRDTGSSGHSSWQEAIEESTPTLEKGMSDATSLDFSVAELDSEESHKIEEPLESPRAQIHDFGDGYIGDSLPKSGFCDFEVNEERDSSSSPTGNSSPGKHIADIHDVSTQVAEISSLETAVHEDGDTESRFPVEGPVYECEVSLVDAEPWTSVTVRLLSIKSKSQVEIHRVVVTYTPGPPIRPPASTNGGNPYQQGVGTSSLLAMLVPGILQMARGMSEQRKARNSIFSSGEKAIEGSNGIPSKVTNGEAPQTSPTHQAIAPDQAKMNENCVPPMVDKTLNGEGEEKTISPRDVAEDNSHGTTPLGSIALEETQVPQPVLEHVKGEGSRDLDESRNLNNETGLLKAHEKLKKDERVDELVQRLDRLETICLRMESSLNTALESMDKRLKLLESGGLGRMPPALGHPIWGPGFDSGSFLSATSVYVPAAQAGPETPSLMDSQIPFTPSSPVDTPVGDSSAKDRRPPTTTETTAFPGVGPFTSPPSLSSALPTWPLSSWPQNVSPDSSSQYSGLTASFISKNGLMNRSRGSLHGSEHPSNGGETYWESRTSDESESDISSDSEQTSYADNCEDPSCACCPESLLSSPTKPAQLVDNALASALSAFSASFGAQTIKGLGKDDEFYHGEDDESDEEEDSFTSEEQVPLVELDSFPSYYEKEEVVNSDAENVLLHGYEAIPLSNEKDLADLSISKVILEDNFWSLEIDENDNINWHDEGLQFEEDKTFRVLEDCVSRTEEGAAKFDSSSAVFIQLSDELSLAHGNSDDSFSADLKRVLQTCAIPETTHGADLGAVLESSDVLEVLQNPFLQDLLAGQGIQSGRLPADCSAELAEMAKNALSSYLAVRDLSKPPASHEELLLQEGLFADEWNWFTSEFSPFSSLVEVRDLTEDAPAEKELVLVDIEAVNMADGSPAKGVPPQAETWSLLDDDVSIPSTTDQFGGEMCSQDWLGQKSQWSLLDEYPPDLIGGGELPFEYPPDLIGGGELPFEYPPDVIGGGELHPEAGLQYGNREPRSLLDEDISMPLGEFPDADEDTNLFASHASLEEHLNLNMSQSPSSVHSASRSNPFEEESDFSQGSNNNAPLVLLDDCEDEVNEPEAQESEGTQSLLFHLSL